MSMEEPVIGTPVRAKLWFGRFEPTVSCLPYPSFFGSRP